MALKIVNHHKGIVANAILSIIYKQLADGKGHDPIEINALCTDLDVSVDRIREALENLQALGYIRRESLEPWANVSTFVVSQPSVLVSVGQISLPSGHDDEAEDFHQVDDILDGAPVRLECGFLDIPIGDGDDRITPPMVIRAGITDGSSPGTANLSIIRRLHDSEIDLQIGEDRSFEVPGEDGFWIDLVVEKGFESTPDGTSAWDAAAQYFRDYCLGLNPSEAQCKRIGLEAATPEPDAGPQEEAG